ncbi:MAG: DUF5329 domain-containing protein [Fibrobacteres bacterium]|jgi:hypothetical protein|nr:DUF5329 domain-containing protein [Fibrobacterota bacterium]
MKLIISRNFPKTLVLGFALAAGVYANDPSKAPNIKTAASDSTPVKKPTKSPQEEVEHLFQYLQKSGCRFNRNGSWYSSEKAVDHLRRKYAYLVKKGLFTTAESFIDKGASTSSMSGTPYQVQCDSLPPAPSGAWLTAELKRYRLANP